MKFARCLSILTALAFVPVTQAQQAKPDAAKKDTPAAAKAKPATPAKPGDAERDKVHSLAVVEIKLGSAREQILIELFPEAAPETVANFIKNANSDTYNGLAFHRAIKDYLVQTGDPLSKDLSARDKWGLSQEYTIKGEPKLPHVVGSVAMARRGDKVNPKQESDGTQFYFALGNLSALNGSYTVFGQVVSGLDVLKRISEVPTDSNDCPLGRVEIKSVKITKQKGPLMTLVNAGRQRRMTRPDALKGPFEKFIERIW
jgi:cyclophilin family peptidyl-prolyl cis-trans isomerase